MKRTDPRDWAITKSRFNLYSWGHGPEGTPMPTSVYLDRNEALDYLGLVEEDLEKVVREWPEIEAEANGTFRLSDLEHWRWGRKLPWE